MIATIVGALGVGANIIIYQQKSRKRILTAKLISDVLWMLHYLLLYAYSGAAIAFIGIFRELVFFHKDKKWAESKLWLIFFLICSVASAVFTWNNPFSLLPAAASIISVISFWQNSPNLTRYLAFVISGCMFTYDIVSGSDMGIINEILTVASTSIGINRYSSKNKVEERL